MEKQRLITPSYCCILAANFLLYFGFWLLVPVLPFYLSEIFHASNTTIGIVLSCYTVSSLCIRPDTCSTLSPANPSTSSLTLSSR